MAVEAVSPKRSVIGRGGSSSSVSLSLEDAELREYLREWRRNKARELGIGASSVLWDTQLEALCVAKPSTLDQLRRVPGFGDKKTEVYGRQILEVLKRFGKGERASHNWQAKAGQPAQETLQLLREGRTLEEIAQIRGRKLSTLVETVAKLVEAGETGFRGEWLPGERYAQIAAALGKAEGGRLKPVKEALPEEVSYGEIRLVIADLKRKREMSGKRSVPSPQRSVATKTRHFTTEDTEDAERNMEPTLAPR